jgi:perosamine synthetase
MASENIARQARSIPLARPYFSEADELEITENIKAVLRSGWLTSGPFTQQFEAKFRKLVGTSESVAVNSCTAALHSILLAQGIGPGDEVIVPSNTFVATANAALYVGARPVLVDCDPQTFNISVKHIQDNITARTKAIICVHIGGNPCEMSEIGEFANEKICLIEDCAHAIGAKYQDTPCGSFGIAGAFSFYPTKVMTSGEGGMVTTNKKELADSIRMIRNQGRGGFGPTENVALGYNFRMSDILAVIGLTQLKHLEDFVAHRNRIADVYSEELSKIGWLEHQKVEKGNICSYYAYIIKLKEDAPISRDELVSKLKDNGIGTSVIFHPVHLQPFYSGRFNYRKGDLPISEEIGERSIALPMDNGINIETARFVSEIIQSLN